MDGEYYSECFRIHPSFILIDVNTSSLTPLTDASEFNLLLLTKRKANIIRLLCE